MLSVKTDIIAPYNFYLVIEQSLMKWEPVLYIACLNGYDSTVQLLLSNEQTLNYVKKMEAVLFIHLEITDMIAMNNFY